MTWGEEEGGWGRRRRGLEGPSVSGQAGQLGRGAGRRRQQ